MGSAIISLEKEGQGFKIHNALPLSFIKLRSRLNELKISLFYSLRSTQIEYLTYGFLCSIYLQRK